MMKFFNKKKNIQIISNNFILNYEVVITNKMIIVDLYYKLRIYLNTVKIQNYNFNK